jgi:hypothetical protein
MYEYIEKTTENITYEALGVQIKKFTEESG